jgi:glucosamine kinase
MFIVVDSGSTKADWAIIDGEKDIIIISTNGINPSTQSDLDPLLDKEALLNYIRLSESIYFYAAGITSTDHQVKIGNWLKSLGFEGVLSAESDTLAGARACFGRKAGILGILGTGSNAAYYDGDVLHAGIPSLGYILSDEGGGVHLGKEIIKSFIYGTMPANVRLVFEQHFGQITKDQVITALYKGHAGSRFLANFASILVDFDGEWKDALFSQCFGEFISTRLLPLKNKYDVPIKLIGTIGYLHREQMKRVAKAYDIHIDEYIQKPILSLIDFHKNN